mmetsp:Transcript_10149/g.30425  ORF Transcript_10149/g.30425 Transcript_10149/m.30425 type:complete len:328 (-) Transcript_10149:368-1351(-)
MSSMRDFLDWTSTDPSARVSANSRGSEGFSNLLLPRSAGTSGRGGSIGATSMGLLSSSSAPFLGFFPCRSRRSFSCLRFSLRFCLSLRGSFGSWLSSTSSTSPLSPSSSEELSYSPLILSSLDPTFWKMSWLNHLAARCSALAISSPASSSTGTRAPSELSAATAALAGGGAPSVPAVCPALLAGRSSLGGPSARARSASPSGLPAASPPSSSALRCDSWNCWNSRSASRSTELSSPPSSSSSASSWSRSMWFAAFCWSRAWLNSFSSPAQAAITRWRLVSFFFFRMRCIEVRCLSSSQILRSSWATATSTSMRASLSKPSSESLSA